MEPERSSLRERKKAATRARILEVAGRLFEARGYDAVTVAEIADAADVSVKTLFAYVRSKEDLAVADTGLLDDVLAAVRDGDPHENPARAVGDVLAGALREHAGTGTDLGVEGYHRRAGDAEALRSRVLRLWADYEDTLTGVLGRRAGREPAPRDRLLAVALLGIVRSFTTAELRREVADAPDEGEQLRSWLAEAVAMVEPLADPGPTEPT